ncbi:MAG: hypothetical protein IJC71_08935 [Clostridia bacterium]|nr:hypothetical protein [Clostridia bacterium]
MDEKILELLTDGAMLPKEDGQALSADLEKIFSRMEQAAQSPLASGALDENPTAARFLNTASVTPASERETELRTDREENCREREIAAQSKRYDAPYTSVPRIL